MVSKKCCVPKCTGNNEDCKMHNIIPSELFEEWLRAISRYDLLKKNRETVRSYYRVCDAHFREDQKVKDSQMKSNLKKDSIPTLGLPSQDDDSICNSVPIENETCNDRRLPSQDNDPICASVPEENQKCGNTIQFQNYVPMEIEKDASMLLDRSEINTDSYLMAQNNSYSSSNNTYCGELSNQHGESSAGDEGPSNSYIESSDNEEGPSGPHIESPDKEGPSSSHVESSDDDDNNKDEESSSSYDESSDEDDDDWESQNPQELSIQWLDSEKISKYINKGANPEIEDTIEEKIEKIIKNYNKSFFKLKKKGQYELQTTVQNFNSIYKLKTYTCNMAGISTLAKSVDTNPKEDEKSHRILFFYKTEPCHIIFALTSGHGYQVVKRYIDYKFPIRVLERIGNPKKILMLERRCLFGESIKERKYIDTKYEYDHSSSLDLYHLIEMLKCEIKCDSSLAEAIKPPSKKEETIIVPEVDEELASSNLLPVLQPVMEAACSKVHSNQESSRKNRKGTSKITIRTSGMLRIQRKIAIHNYPPILNVLVDYMLGEKTYNKMGEEEKNDSSFTFLNFPCISNKPIRSLNQQLIEDIFEQYQTRRKTEFYIRHKHLDDFISSNLFEIKMYGEYRYKKIGEKPPTVEEISSKINEPDKDKFIKKFSNSNLRFGKKVDQAGPLTSFIEGEIHMEGNSYFKLRGVWYELTCEYTAQLFKDFKNLINTSLIKKGSEAFLRRIWLAGEIEDLYNVAYVNDPGYLVLDKVFGTGQYPSTEPVECCDILKYTEDTIYLYHVKEKFGRDTREATSQILNAAKLIRSSMSSNQPENYLQRLWSYITNMPDEAANGKANAKTNAIKKIFRSEAEFLNIFHRRKVIFVYVYCPKEGKSLSMELNKYYIKYSTFTIVAAEDRIVLFQKLVELGYLDPFGNLTGKFYHVRENDFNVEGQFEEKSSEIFQLLKEYRPSSYSSIAKLELVQVASDLKRLGFEFKICEIRSHNQTQAEKTVLPKERKKKTQLPSHSKKRKIK